MRTASSRVCAACIALAMVGSVWAANDGVNDPATFPDVDIFIVVAKRSAVAEDEANKAAHLEGQAQAQRTGNTLEIKEPEGGDENNDGDESNGNEEDGFIVLTQDNPGKSSNTDVPRGHLSN